MCYDCTRYVLCFYVSCLDPMSSCLYALLLQILYLYVFSLLISSCLMSMFCDTSLYVTKYPLNLEGDRVLNRKEMVFIYIC